MFVHPIQAPLVLMQASIESLPMSQISYGVLYSLLWVGIAYAFGQRALYWFVVTKEGVKKL